MPLNHQTGESLDGMPGHFVANKDHWRNTSLWNTACEQAAQAFHASGAMFPVLFDDSDILVQEYPSAKKLVFIFLRGIAGHEHYYVYTFDLDDKAIAELRVTGRWPYRN